MVNRELTFSELNFSAVVSREGTAPLGPHKATDCLQSMNTDTKNDSLHPVKK